MSIERANVKGPLSKKLMICDTKDPPPKSQPSIRSKSARIKTWTDKYNGYDLSCFPSQS